MTPHNEEAWAAEFEAGFDQLIRVLRWAGVLVSLYIIGSIVAALGVM